PTTTASSRSTAPDTALSPTTPLSLFSITPPSPPSSPFPYTTLFRSTSFTHSSLTNGTTYFYRLCATDNAGNTSTGITASAVPQAPDTTAPAGSLTINAGATYTSATSVTLALAATDTVGVTAYYLSTSATTPAASAAGWTTVTSSTSYTGTLGYALSAGDGTKTLYTWYKD